MSITVVSPVAPPPVQRVAGRTLSARPTSLSGQVLAVVWNRLARSDVFFRALADRLTESEHLADVVWVSKPSQSVPPTDEDWSRLSAATVAVAGFGGCGSCSARSMRDLIELDWLGVPGTWVGHSALAASARAIAALSGHADYPMIYVDYPYAVTASWTDKEANRLAVDLAPRVARSLVSSVAEPANMTGGVR